ncbi:MAG: ornithine carbamoyltransferase [Candidatus Omnitrophica bacterium]|nr:ornithine carbamoyltransferase [Candidatus Omnitrophota bacterium]MDD4013078.1 ornithine carbamoyltransferase [Candidatus Omnitrophota bacterium]
MKKKKDLLTLGDMREHEIIEILDLARRMKKAPFSKKGVFRDKTLALLFQKPSNRTRISFEVAMVQLGGHALYLSPQEICMGKRESVKDVARVVARYVDGIVARVFSHSDVKGLAEYSPVPVINGLSDAEHPCQALSDIFTIREKFKTLKNITVTYIGDGNNVLSSLMLACAKTGMKTRISTPKEYGPEPEALSLAAKAAKEMKTTIELFADPFEAAKGADVVYTDVWVSMGQEDERDKRLEDFKGFQVDSRVMSAAKKNAVVMHCLPAHRGEEISEDVIDGPASVIYDQAENRLHVQKAVLLKYLS